MTIRNWTVLLALLAMAGCSGGGSAVRFFIIDPVANAPLRSDAGSSLAVEVMDLQVPQYLERPRIASRTGDNELVFSQNNQWGDNLRKNLARTLARNLSVLLDTPDVSTPYNRSTTQPAYRVLVHIDEFEQTADGHTRITARWQLISGSTGETILTDQALLQSDTALPRDHAVVVASLRELYGELSVRIARSVVSQMGGA